MALFSSEDHVLIDKLNDRDIMNQAFLDTLSLNERKGYTNQLKNDTMAMLKYEFSSSKLKHHFYQLSEKRKRFIKNRIKRYGRNILKQLIIRLSREVIF